MSATDTGGRPVVVITGASRGIGLGVACLLVANRVPLMVTARGAERLEKVGTFLRAQGSRVETCPCDAADEAAMSQAFLRAAKMGPIGALLNNAGVLEPIAPISDIDVAVFEAHLRTNVTGVLLGIKLAFTHRNPNHTLRIVNVSSGAATQGYRGWAAYCASKAAVNLLTEVAHAEADGDTSVVAIAPGIIETQMQRTIRKTSKDRFPDVGKFQELKNAGALLHPVDAAVSLVWLLGDAPLQLSGKFVDARDENMQRLIASPDAKVVERAKGWFDQLETED